MNQTKQSGVSVSVQLMEALRLHNEGKLIDAKVYYEKILLIEPANFDALHLLGVIYKQSGEPLRAIEYIKSSVTINPNISWTYTNLGCAYDDIGNKEEALKNLNHAIKITHQANLFIKDPVFYEYFANQTKVYRDYICCPDKCTYFWPLHKSEVK
jgi:tetratricopeptide (TPR) repeat protein